ncbi:hypothetical protein FACS1894216_02290 [Synergistales bacterium]|nr:hypothetical protein FACS1894216_02290 [Synergistales bacterium]
MKLRLSERDTDGCGYFLWRTPDAHCDRGASSEARYERKLREKMPISLNDQVRFLPTPKVGGRNSRGAIIDKNGNGKKSGLALEQAIECMKGILPRELNTPEELPPMYKKIFSSPRMLPTPTAGGRLNPNFVEMLMGFPQDWTAL